MNLKPTLQLHLLVAQVEEAEELRFRSKATIVPRLKAMKLGAMHQR